MITNQVLIFLDLFKGSLQNGLLMHWLSLGQELCWGMLFSSPIAPCFWCSNGHSDLISLWWSLLMTMITMAIMIIIIRICLHIHILYKICLLDCLFSREKDFR
ncbi:uncharacterized protein LOC106416908 [Brassica napus]|uniref:uncharacterized protein LOC106416908 n=1 Tax=Brassica napus TaxID=3708 RepID=UPI0006AB34EC|nr:uncharacterized protein LOC106416908 [Brassica napus]